MNRRRVSSPPTARARVPLDLSHPFTALDARHATESTTEGLNRRVRARITRNAMISTRDASIVPFKRSCRSKRSFVHVIARSSRSSRSSRSPARVVIHSFTHVMHARHAFVAACVEVTHDESRLIIPLFVSFSFSKRAQKKIKKINTRAKSTRDPHGGGYTRVMTQHIERNTSHDRARGKYKNEIAIAREKNKRKKSP